MVALRTAKPVRNYVMGVHCPDRGNRWLSVSSQPVFDADGVVPSGVVTTFIDITEKHDSFERIRQLAQRVEVVREDERRVIATRLHEGVAQDLFAAQLALKHLETQAKGRSGVMQAYQELSVALTNCMESARMLANELRPAGLAHERLRDALQRHANLVGQRCGLDVEVSESEYFPVLDEKTQLLFFRTVQEALTNVVRHAKARRVGIRLLSQSDRIVLVVEDDGVGIRAADLRKPGSLGIIGLRERFTAEGGGFEVEAREQGGTRLSAFVNRC
jgi:signal transduction histidine kinase